MIQHSSDWDEEALGWPLIVDTACWLHFRTWDNKQGLLKWLDTTLELA